MLRIIVIIATILLPSCSAFAADPASLAHNDTIPPPPPPNSVTEKDIQDMLDAQPKADPKQLPHCHTTAPSNYNVLFTTTPDVGVKDQGAGLNLVLTGSKVKVIFHETDISYGEQKFRLFVFKPADGSLHEIPIVIPPTIKHAYITGTVVNGESGFNVTRETIEDAKKGKHERFQDNIVPISVPELDSYTVDTNITSPDGYTFVDVNVLGKDLNKLNHTNRFFDNLPYFSVATLQKNDRIVCISPTENLPFNSPDNAPQIPAIYRYFIAWIIPSPQ